MDTPVFKSGAYLGSVGLFSDHNEARIFGQRKLLSWAGQKFCSNRETLQTFQLLFPFPCSSPTICCDVSTGFFR